ncbi:MAG TPA: cytochrome c oxidase subunit II [Burkholderiales bacterium]|nr:cytochrome c oxidase subunit II [Burkholderiales bacterium]
MTRCRLGALPLLAFSRAAASATFQSVWTPAGVQSEHVHSLWLVMLGLCGVVFGAVFIAFLLAIGRAPRVDETSEPQTSRTVGGERGAQRAVAIGAALSIAGLLALIVASVVTDRALASLSLENGFAIEVSGKQWWWQATYYPGDPQRTFETANELHIPVGKPVVLKLSSPDVIHSFWVPSLAPKKDMIPGRTLTLTLRADKAGVYRGQCAEFCGFQHAKMAFLVYADEPAQYEAWVRLQQRSASEPSDAIAKRGRDVFMSSPCVMCHTIQGTTAQAKLGPDLTHVASRATLAAGVLPNARGPLSGWITNPQQIKPGTNMPAVALPPEDLHALVTYLESLR